MKFGDYKMVDNYLERIYPENHKYYERYHQDLLYWINLFSKSRNKQKKGLIQINY